MTKNMIVALLGALFVMPLAGSSVAAIISDDFDADTSADYTLAENGADGTVTFAYDYSADGIPAAPGSVTTLGLKLTANDTDPKAAESRTLFSNTGVTAADFELSVDVWMNVSGTGGTTEFGHIGIDGDGSTVNSLFSPITGSGYFVAFTGEGGSSSDFRHSRKVSKGGLTNTGDPSYLNSSNTTNATGDTYQTIFSAVNGYTDFPGSPGNNWATLTITKVGGTVTYAFNGTPIIETSAGRNLADDGNQVSLGYADLFTSVANPFQSQFVVYDNLTVTAIPEPGTFALLGLGGLGLLLRRRSS